MMQAKFLFLFALLFVSAMASSHEQYLRESRGIRERRGRKLETPPKTATRPPSPPDDDYYPKKPKSRKSKPKDDNVSSGGGPRTPVKPTQPPKEPYKSRGKGKGKGKKSH